MRLKFLSKGFAPKSYTIEGRVINGIDTSLFLEGSTFVGNEATLAAGIFDMQWVDGELSVTLGQMTKAYQFSVPSHSWQEGVLIDSTDYSPTTCYVKAVCPQAVTLLENGFAEYFQDTDGRWSVRMIKTEEQEPVA